MVLGVLLGFSPHVEDQETEGERKERMSVIRDAVTEAARKVPWRHGEKAMTALLLEQGFSESRFAWHIHAGLCKVKQGECDSGKAGSVWQIQHGGWFPKKKWEKIIGLDLKATTAAATKAAEILAAGDRKCGSIEGSIALYATGKRCRWSGTKKRMQLYRRIRAQLD